MKKSRTVELVVKAGLCTGCGTCAGLCPRDALDMVIDPHRGVYLPRLNRDSCDECGLCYEVCPGHAVDFRRLNLDIYGKEPEDILLGNYRNFYIGHAVDEGIRYDASSGGLVTALLIFALEEGLISGALVTRMRRDRPLEPEPFIARTREEIISAARSKYCPVPANIALKEIIESKDGEKFAVVGLPCHLQGIRKAEMLNKKLKDKIVLHLGIICSHSDTFSETEFIIKKYGIKKEDVTRLNYRGHGWPGGMTVHTKDGKVEFVSYDEYIVFHELYFFSPRRCTLCCDMVARLADITFMDAWLHEIMVKDKAGSSIIITRTEKGEVLCQNAKLKQVVKLEAIASSKVIASQGRARLTNKDLHVFFSLSRLFGNSVPDYNLKLPKSGFVNYLRAFVIYFNSWVSSKVNLRYIVKPLVYMQKGIFQRVKAKI